MHLTEEAKPRTFVFYIVPDFTMLAFTAAIEALRLANAVLGREAYSWRIVTADGKPVRASCGIPVASDRSVSEERLVPHSERADMIIVCAGWNVEKAVDKSVAGWLRQSRKSGVEIAGVCTGAFILGNAGLLADRRCTIHWEHIPMLRELFPTAVVGGNIMESDGDVHTCAGGIASFDMILHFVSERFGRKVVLAIGEQAIIGRQRDPSERQRSHRRTLGSLNPLVIAAVEFMEDNIIEQVKISAVAEHINLSRRQMERVFAREIATSPARLYLELRLDHARLMVLQSSMPIVDIAIGCGFVSASHFSKCFRQFHGASPQSLREQRQRSVFVPALKSQSEERNSVAGPSFILH
ncbi:GlxA family transcriptional regulator [Rhizobium sp. NZLR3b]|uniref:GlxA family transcriptional regulator n=1 Tax=Rhizobium sp. NZLR3b TaxID=2731101 RepID=UPI001C83D21B|nr:GlxA family transcriptional regulator [Rhizobium sp. NZLR3b]MBX5192531.1 GlxA family transcriptional regulator [Rhizobium sp. NZLR3b]